MTCPSRLTLCFKGIHDLTYILGIEASRDIEETTFQGVRYIKLI